MVGRVLPQSPVGGRDRRVRYNAGRPHSRGGFRLAAGNRRQKLDYRTARGRVRSGKLARRRPWTAGRLRNRTPVLAAPRGTQPPTFAVRTPLVARLSGDEWCSSSPALAVPGGKTCRLAGDRPIRSRREIGGRGCSLSRITSQVSRSNQSSPHAQAAESPRSKETRIARVCLRRAPTATRGTPVLSRVHALSCSS